MKVSLRKNKFFNYIRKWIGWSQEITQKFSKKKHVFVSAIMKDGKCIKEVMKDLKF